MEDAQRIVLEVAYQGGAYAGWQLQTNAHSVQEALEKGLSVLLGSEIRVTAAGRTDAGVHALQQFLHFDAPVALPFEFVRKLNGILPNDIAIRDLYWPARPDFHARFDAVRRGYFYRISTAKNPFRMTDSLMWYRPLDLEAMRSAASVLTEYEDFASFCKLHGNNKTTLCNIFSAGWTEEQDLLVFHIEANRFLRGMVRCLVGTLLLVGSGKLDREGFRQIIERKDRRVAGPNASAKGLFLCKVAYPEGELISGREKSPELY